MKHLFKLFMTPLAILFAFCFILGCSSEQVKQDNENTLYRQMLSYSQHLAELRNQMGIETRSTDEMDEFVLPSGDISLINPNIVEYLELYTQSDNILDWDEEGILSLVEVDPRFSQEEKDYFIRALGGVYSMKQQIIQTRADVLETPVECMEARLKAQKRASTTYLIALALAMIAEPETPFGEAAAYLWYSKEMIEIEEDYQECLQKATGDCSIVDFWEDDGPDVDFWEEDGPDEGGAGDDDLDLLEEDAGEDENAVEDTLPAIEEAGEEEDAGGE